MDRVREVCSTASALRKAEGLRVRLPLARLTVVADDAAALRPFAGLVTDELNVRDLVLTDLAESDADAFGVRQVLQVNARAAGPRLGREVQTAIRGAKAGEWSAGPGGSVTAGGITLLEDEYTLQTVVADADPSDRRAVAMLLGGGFVILDTAVTPELAAEGLARDVVRAVQQARREAGLAVSDRIRLAVTGDPGVVEAVGAHAELIKSEVLATSLALGEDGLQVAIEATVGDRQTARISLARVQ
jgi:isoleucyl-tRNA synthetase